MKATELLAEIKAEAELKAMGWTKTTCTHCKGNGCIPDCTDIACSWCDGSGWIWTAPITKQSGPLKVEFPAIT